MHNLRQRNHEIPPTSIMNTNAYKDRSRPVKLQGFMTTPNPFWRMKKSERIAWIIVCFQVLVIISHRHQPLQENLNNVRGSGVGGGSGSISSSSSLASSKTITTATNPNTLIINGRPSSNYKENKDPSKPFYDEAMIHPKDAGLVSRAWHSNGYPSINPNLQKGSCWCGADEWYVFNLNTACVAFFFGTCIIVYNM